MYTNLNETFSRATVKKIVQIYQQKFTQPGIELCEQINLLPWLSKKYVSNIMDLSLNTYTKIRVQGLITSLIQSRKFVFALDRKIFQV